MKPTELSSACLPEDIDQNIQGNSTVSFLHTVDQNTFAITHGTAETNDALLSLIETALDNNPEFSNFHGMVSPIVTGIRHDVATVVLEYLRSNRVMHYINIDELQESAFNYIRYTIPTLLPKIIKSHAKKQKHPLPKLTPYPTPLPLQYSYKNR